MIFNSIEKKLDKYDRLHPNQPQTIVKNCGFLNGANDCPCIRHQNIYEKHLNELCKEKQHFQPLTQKYQKLSTICKLNMQIQNNTKRFIKTGSFSCRNYSEQNQSQSEKSLRTILSPPRQYLPVKPYSTASTNKIKINKLLDNNQDSENIDQRIYHFKPLDRSINKPIKKPVDKLLIRKQRKDPQTQIYTNQVRKNNIAVQTPQPIQEQITFNTNSNQYFNLNSQCSQLQKPRIMNYTKQINVSVITPEQQLKQKLNKRALQIQSPKKVANILHDGKLAMYILLGISLFLILLQIFR